MIKSVLFIFAAWFLLYGLGFEFELFSKRWWIVCIAISALSMIAAQGGKSDG